MSLELVNAIASVTTAVVIAATAIAAIIQLRHLRMNNQIQALLSVQNEFNEKDYRDADAVVRREFPEILEDENFCAYMIAVLGNRQRVEEPKYLEARQLARFIGNTYEAIGVMVKKGMIDTDLLLDAFAYVLAGGWENLEGYVAMVRSVTGEPSLYENFEYVASLSRDYLATHSSVYPKGVKRLNPRLPVAAAKLLDQGSVNS